MHSLVKCDIDDQHAKYVFASIATQIVYFNTQVSLT